MFTRALVPDGASVEIDGSPVRGSVPPTLHVVSPRCRVVRSAFRGRSGRSDHKVTKALVVLAHRVFRGLQADRS